MPNKVIADVNGLPLICHIYRRLLACREIDTVLASWGCACNGARCDKCAPLVDLLEARWMKNMGGPEENLLLRHANATRYANCDAFVRITADCWMHDPNLIDAWVRQFREQWPRATCGSNWKPRMRSEGVDCDIWTLERIFELYSDRSCPREDFATYGMNGCRLGEAGSFEVSEIKTSIDAQEDLSRLKRVMKKIGNNEFGYWTCLNAWREAGCEA